MARVAEVGLGHGAPADAAAAEADANKGTTAAESLDSKFNVFQYVAELPDGKGKTVTAKRGPGSR